MTQTADVLIVGGGSIGLTCAYELARAGSQVIVLERDQTGHAASWAAVGILPPGNPDRATDPVDRMRAESFAAFPHFTAQLRDLTGIDPGFALTGGFEYQNPHEPLPLEMWNAEHIVYEQLSAADVRKRETGVVGRDAYFLPDVAQVRTPRLMQALAAACTTLGVTIVPNAEVTDWMVNKNSVIAAKTAQESYSASEFLVCGGTWTDALMARFGCRLGVKPIRGQIVLYRLHEPGPRFIHQAGPDYLVPRGDGLVLAGSTQEDAGFAPYTTEAAIAKIRKFAENFAPPLANATIEVCWAGLRPGSADDRPSMGRVPSVANLSVAAGHYRAGISTAPATGRLMMELYTGRKPFIPLESFSPGRVPHSPRSGEEVVPVESSP